MRFRELNFLGTCAQGWIIIAYLNRHTFNAICNEKNNEKKIIVVVVFWGIWFGVHADEVVVFDSQIKCI